MGAREEDKREKTGLWELLTGTVVVVVEGWTSQEEEAGCSLPPLRGRRGDGWKIGESRVVAVSKNEIMSPAAMTHSD